jgi:hypothetical protein
MPEDNAAVEFVKLLLATSAITLAADWWQSRSLAQFVPDRAQKTLGGGFDHVQYPFKSLFSPIIRVGNFHGS